MIVAKFTLCFIEISNDMNLEPNWARLELS